MRIVLIAATLASAALELLDACRGARPAGPPARNVAGQAGSVVVNGRRPARIAVRVLDAGGHVLPDRDVRFQWAAGVPPDVSPTGEVTCAGRGEATGRAALTGATTDVRIRCLPMEALRLATPFQLLVGGTARALPVVAYGVSSTDESGVSAVSGTGATCPRHGGLSVRADHAGRGSGR